MHFRSISERSLNVKADSPLPVIFDDTTPAAIWEMKPIEIYPMARPLTQIKLLNAEGYRVSSLKS